MAISITLQSQTADFLSAPNIVAYGFPELNEVEDLVEKTSQVVHFALENHTGSVLDWYNIKEDVTRLVTEMLYKETRKRPVVLVLVQPVD